MTITMCATATKSSVGSCATHRRRWKHLGFGWSRPKASAGHGWRIAGMPLAASTHWRNFGRDGFSTTLFAIAWLTLRPHRWPRLLLVAFGATPKFGSRWTAQATSGGFVGDAHARTRFFPASGTASKPWASALRLGAVTANFAKFTRPLC